MADDALLDDDRLTDDLPEDGGRPDDRIDDERMDEENTLKPEFVRRVEDVRDEGDEGAVYDLVEPRHPADVADLLELFDREDRRKLASAITDLMTGDVVAELNDYVRDDMMEDLPAASVAQIAEQLETDDAVQLIEDLDEEDQQAILAELGDEDRIAIESALAYPEETAGRLMSRELVAVPEHMSVGDLIDFLRDGRDLPQDFFEVFVVDERHHPVGTCQLSWILRPPRRVALADGLSCSVTRTVTIEGGGMNGGGGLSVGDDFALSDPFVGDGGGGDHVEATRIGKLADKGLGRGCSNFYGSENLAHGPIMFSRRLCSV